MLSVENISFSYGKRKIVDDLSFHARSGECVVLAGPNGSGKSTALSIMAGALKPSAGSVRVGGRVGYVPQGTALLEDATVEENLRFFASLQKCRVPDTLPFSVETYKKRKVSALSGGMKKQVSIACAMIGDPEVILLDEPCAALDIAFRDEMTELIKGWKRGGRAIVYVGHEPSEFYDVFDTLILMSKPAEIYTREALADAARTAETFASFYREKLKDMKKGEQHL